MLVSLLVLPVSGVAVAAPPPWVAPSGSSATKDAVCSGIGGCDVNGNTQGVSLSGTANFILNLLSFVAALISVIMIVIGGIKYATSSGDSNEISNAKNTILYALVGLIVAVLAKPIVNLILRSVT